MNTLESAVLEGLRGARSFKLEFNEKANSIIGVNGTGKTTVIDLISKVISCDVPGLKKSRFKRVKLVFSSGKGKAKPTIEVLRESGGVIYRISSSKGADPVVWVFDFSDFMSDGEGFHGFFYDGSDEDAVVVKKTISKICDHSWLNIHRGRDESPSSVSERLDNIQRELANCFTDMDREYYKLSKSFQEKLLLSNLEAHSIDPPKETDFDMKEVLNQAVDLYSIFGVSKKVVEKSIRNHMVLVDKYVEEGSKGLTVEVMSALINLSKLQNIVVNDWGVLKSKKDKIYEPKSKFKDIVSSMFYEKNLIIGDDSSIYITTDKGDRLDLYQLSSGEKQLFILLGETLLQNGKPFVYIADEPELSLHIDWQEKLIPSIMGLNPKCQMIFATHSPDVAGSYPKGIINIEKCRV